MSGKVLLDTNVVVRLLGGDAAANERVREFDQACLCVVVLGELWHGAKSSARPAESVRTVEELARRFDWLPCTVSVAAEFGRIKAELRRRGRPIPENDVWIAAVATAYALTLITDDRHFQEVTGLDLLPC